MNLGDLASGVGLLILGVLFYVLSALPLYVIAKKLENEYAWLAYVPFGNIWLMCDLGGKDWWWMLLLLVPLLNIVAIVMIWMGIAENLNQPAWLGVLMLVPLLNFIIMYYLAFASKPLSSIR